MKKQKEKLTENDKQKRFDSFVNSLKELFDMNSVDSYIVIARNEKVLKSCSGSVTHEEYECLVDLLVNFLLKLDDEMRAGVIATLLANFSGSEIALFVKHALEARGESISDYLPKSKRSLN